VTKLPRAYAVTSKNKRILLKSSSGGVFFHLASYFLNNNGSVYGTAMENGVALTKRITKITDLPQLMGSKYVLTDTMKTFAECAADLKKGIKVLYISTPCIINSLHNFLHKNNIETENLLSGDVFCFGTPNKIYLEKYLIEKFPNKKIKKVDFRFKKPSWENYSLKINNKRINSQNDEYFKAFLGGYSLIKSCFSCKQKGENRVSDFSIGDFWGIKQYYPELYNKHGVSLLIVRNKSWLVDILSSSCIVNEVDYGLAISNNPAYYLSVKKPDDYDSFQKSTQDYGFIQTIQNHPTLSKQKNSVIKKILRPFYNLVFKKKNKGKRTSYDITSLSVGIITDDGYRNFGNRLQNYALRDKITSFGYNPVNIVFDKTQKILFGSFLYKGYYLLEKIRKRPVALKRERIKKAALKSNEKNVFFNYNKKSKQLINKFPKIVIGSDQVWNWTYNWRRIMFNLGVFGSHFKGEVFSYAASFGIDYIDDRYKPLYKHAFLSISNIGVREEKGLEIVKSLGYESVLTADPTFLLSKSNWKKAINNYSKIKLPKNYVLGYLLWKNKEQRNNLNDYAASNLLNVVNISDEKGPFYSINHFDFLNLILNAEVVFTDSFHAMIFSVIFGKKAVIFDKKGMTSRFTSLFSILSLPTTFNKLIDFSKVDKSNLDELIKFSEDYLKKNLQSVS